MLKISILFLVFINLFLIASCQKDTSPIIQTPDWLITHIEQIENDDFYYGTVIYRYKWKNNYYYNAIYPFCSNQLCEVWDNSGQKVIWRDRSEGDDFLNNRTSRTLIWKWEQSN